MSDFLHLDLRTLLVLGIVAFVLMLVYLVYEACTLFRIKPPESASEEVLQAPETPPYPSPVGSRFDPDTVARVRDEIFFIFFYFIFCNIFVTGFPVKFGLLSPWRARQRRCRAYPGHWGIVPF
jgi:hypothetical protein